MGVYLKQLGFESPVLVDLRGEFDKVAVYVCACLALEACTRQHAVETVTEFVEHGLDFVEGEEAGVSAVGREKLPTL